MGNNITNYFDVNQEKIATKSCTPDKKPIEEKANSYTFNYDSWYTYFISCYVIEGFIKQQEYVTITKEDTREFEYDFDKKTEIMINGTYSFYFENNVIGYSVYNRRILLFSEVADISKLVELLKNKIKKENPLRGKFLQLINSGRETMVLLKRPPKIKFNDVILNEKLKNDIHDNTIYQLDHLKGNNGIILFGEPGTGNS